MTLNLCVFLLWTNVPIVFFVFCYLYFVICILNFPFSTEFKPHKVTYNIIFSIFNRNIICCLILNQ